MGAKKGARLRLLRAGKVTVPCLWTILCLATPAGAQKQGVKLTSVENEIVFNFQNERGTRTRVVRLDLSEETKSQPVAVMLGDFTSTSGPQIVQERYVIPRIKIDSDSETAELQITVNPDFSNTWLAGEFTSSVRLAGKGVESVTIPVKLIFRSGPPVWASVLAVGVLGLGVLIGYVFRANESTATAPVDDKRKPLLKAAPPLIGVVTAIGIVVFGLDSQFLSNDTFGSGGLSDWIALLAWGFGAGFSGKTLSDFTKTKTAR